MPNQSLKRFYRIKVPVHPGIVRNVCRRELYSDALYLEVAPCRMRGNIQFLAICFAAMIAHRIRGSMHPSLERDHCDNRGIHTSPS